MTTYTSTDTVDSLTAEQLALMARSDHSFLVFHIAERTYFDAHRIRLLLELGEIEAKRRLDALGQSSATAASVL